MTARMCAICKKAPRESDPMDQPIRLAPEDCKGHTDAKGQAIQPGLSQCCVECYERYRPIIHARLVKNPPADAQGYTTRPDGSPAVVVPPLESFHGNWLM